MTREQIKQLFPDATEEQITSLLNQHNTEIQTEKQKNKDSKTELERLKEIEKELNAEKEKSLTAEQKLQKALDDANAEKANLIRQQNQLSVEKKLASAGLSEDDYKDLLDVLVTDDATKSLAKADAFISMIGKQKEQIEKSTREKLLNDTTNPGGNGGGDEDKPKTKAEEFASNIAKEFSGTSADANEILKNY